MMVRTTVGTTLLAIVSCAAFGQPPAGPAFDAASVKPAPPPTGRGFMMKMGGGPGTQDPGRVEYTNVSLRDMVKLAYGLKDYQVSGPDWLSTARFDVVATLPPTTPKDQYLMMWQNLLAERFKITVHKEKKELPVYALVVGKGGSKLKASVEDPAAAPSNGANSSSPAVSFGGPSAAPGGGGGAVAGEFRFTKAPGGAGMAGRGGMMMLGLGHVAAKKSTTAGLADLLSRQLDRPVLDMTELTGNYDFVLDWSPDETQGMSAMGKAGGEGPEKSGESIFSAVQSQLGLKLEARKSPIDCLVVDRAEKVPTEN